MRWLAVLVVAGALAPFAAAHPESEAAALWQAQEGSDLVVAAGHRPGVVAAGNQWTAFLELRDGGPAVSAAAVKVCIMDLLVCIIPPQNATRSGDEWTFDTGAFAGADGQPYAWSAGSRLGVQWILTFDDRVVDFPRGTALEDPSCAGRAVECFETHYLVFAVEGKPAAEASSPLWAVVAAVGLAAFVRRGTLL